MLWSVLFLPPHRIKHPKQLFSLMKGGHCFSLSLGNPQDGSIETERKVPRAFCQLILNRSQNHSYVQEGKYSHVGCIRVRLRSDLVLISSLTLCLTQQGLRASFRQLGLHCLLSHFNNGGRDFFMGRFIE